MTNSQPSDRPYAVVTGASSGIGFELARQFVDHGFDVLMVAEDDGIESAAISLGGQSLQVDLTDDDGVERLWSTVNSTGRALEALAINAGIGNAGPFIESSLYADLEVISLNVTSTVKLAKLALPAMVA